MDCIHHGSDSWGPHIQVMYDVSKPIVNYSYFYNIDAWYKPTQDVWFIIALQT